MIRAYEWQVALRYLRPRREEGFLTVVAVFSVLGIAVGVATLIVVLAVMNGFPNILVKRALAVNGDFLVYGARPDAAEADAVAERLAAVAGVRAAYPIIEGGVLANAPGGAAGVRVQGMRAADLARHNAVAGAVRAGSLEAFARRGAIVIGSRLAERLALAPGDRVTLVSSEGRSTVFGTVPRAKSFTVAAVFDLGIYEYDEAYVFVPLEDARVFFRPARPTTGFTVWLEPGVERRAARRAIVAAAPRGAGVLDWAAYVARRFAFVAVQRDVVVLILSLIVVVAALNIVSGLTIMVTEKSPDIGVLRTLGAGRFAIARIFVLSGLMIGGAGTALGIALGVAFAENIEVLRQWVGAMTGVELFSAEIYNLSEVPSELRALDLLAVAGGTLGLSFLSTLVPSLRAARLDPVEALHRA